MHAYATDDPIFLAMNARGQDEAALGDFCVQCHAPMALVEGYSDFRAVGELPRHLKGVTCYFCHSVRGVGEPHNNSLIVPGDGEVLYGPYENPHEAAPHRAEHSAFLDGRTTESSRMCGSCHDIVTPRGVHMERTYEEWQSSNLNSQGCARGCHMLGRSDTAVSGEEAPPGVPLRSVRAGEGVHEHLFGGVDQALIDWASDDPALTQLQRAVVDCELANALQVTEICLTPTPGGNRLDLTLEAVGVGHAWPSGSAMDRRAWVELQAYRQGELLFESAVGPEEAVHEVQRAPQRQLFVMRDFGYDAEGREAHMFWKLEPSTTYPKGYESRLIPAGNVHSVTATYQLPAARPDRIDAVVKIRAIGKDFLRDLYESGYLSPQEHRPIETLTLRGTDIRFEPAEASQCRSNPEVQSPPIDCRSQYARLLEDSG